MMMFWDIGGIYGCGIQDWVNFDFGNILMQVVVGCVIIVESDMFFVKVGVLVEDRIVNFQFNGNMFVFIQDNGMFLMLFIDYMFFGDMFMFKVYVFVKYVMGVFGEKVILMFYVNVGFVWKIFVWYFDKFVFGLLMIIIGVVIYIFVVFNGDFFVMMEFKYVNGVNVGLINWILFQLFGEVFRLNYVNNIIVFDDNFFCDVFLGIVNFDFYFWSGLILKYWFEIKEWSFESGIEYVIYDDNFVFGWYDWFSWILYNLVSMSEVYFGL